MKKLGELLVEKKIITPKQLEELLNKQKTTKERLGDLVVKAGYLNTDQLVQFIAEQYDLKYVNLKNYLFPVSLQKNYNFEILKSYRIVPLKEEDNKVYIGINNVNLLKKMDELSFKLKKNIVPVILSELAIDKILSELEALPYGSKDYLYKSIETYLLDTDDIDSIITTIFDYDTGIDRIFLKEDVPPFIKKANVTEKIPVAPFTRVKILNIIKKLCDENERKILINKGSVTFKKKINDKSIIVNIYRDKNSYYILIINQKANFKKLSDYELDNVLLKNLIDSPKGIIFLVAPFGHGKSTFFSSIIDYYNINKKHNILYVSHNPNLPFENINSNIIQIDRADLKSVSEFDNMLNAIDPSLLFVRNVDNANILPFLYKFVESGRAAYVSIESDSIQSAIESILYQETESSLRYHLNRIADHVRLFMNFRIIPGNKGNETYFIYEHCLNSFNLRKTIRTNTLNQIATQIRGTADYIPFEIQLVELFTKGLVDYDVAESFAMDLELFKRYAKISGA